MSLLNAYAFIGIEETYRLISEGDETVELAKRDALADLINAACSAIESYVRGPIIAQEYKEYYYGLQANNVSLFTAHDQWQQVGPDRTNLYLARYVSQRIFTKFRPIVEDNDHPLVVRVRTTGNALDQAATTWETWTEGTDYIVDFSSGILTVNPIVRISWPAGFRNVYVDYWAGRGVQELDDEDEVASSTVLPDIRLAAKELVRYWWKQGIVEYGQQYIDNIRPQATGMSFPPIVTDLLSPYVMKRPMNWLLI